MLVALSCPTLCNSVVCRPPGSSVHGILQARILKWVDVPFSRGSFQPRDRTQASCVAGRFLTVWGMREARVCVCVWGGSFFPSPNMCHLIFKDFQALFLSQSWTFSPLFPFSLLCSILISLLTVFPQYGVCLGVEIWVVASENSCVPSCSSLFWNFSKTLCPHMLLDEAKPLQFLPPVFKIGLPGSRECLLDYLLILFLLPRGLWHHMCLVCGLSVPVHVSAIKRMRIFHLTVLKLFSFFL